MSSTTVKKEKEEGLELLTERTPLVKSPGSFFAEIGSQPKRLFSCTRRGKRSSVGVLCVTAALATLLVTILVLHSRTNNDSTKVGVKPNHELAKDDFMSHLPGHEGPLPTEWYSGYLEYKLPAMDNRLVHTHYIYVEAQQSDESASLDDTPVIFWSNGGPGASSLFGLMTEFGPFSLNSASLQTDEYYKTGVPTMFPNVHSWNKIGSILMLDAPAPVGYSYCDENVQSASGLSCGDWDDDSAAWNNYLALLEFYQKFPLLQKRPLYLTGQSYAGIYVPLLAKKILQHQETASTIIPLKGFAVGNPCFGTNINCVEDPPFYELFFLAGHGQLSMELYRNVMETCGGEEELKRIGIQRNQECNNLLQQIPRQAGGVFDYNLYNDCPYDDQVAKSSRATRLHSNIVTSNGLNDYVCGGGLAMETWVQHAKVKQALHVYPNAAFFDDDDGEGMNYTQSESDLSGFYIDLAKGKYGPIQVMVYDGDSDPCINSMLAQDFLRNLGLPQIEAWRPWTLDGCRRMGGYITRYEGSLDFVTIRGSGHFVPYNKPEAAFTFIKSWIRNETFPEYDAECEHP